MAASPIDKSSENPRMRFTRFEDPQGHIRYGAPLGADTAQPLAGNPFEGLNAVGAPVDVRRWLAPIIPQTIYCIGLNYRKHAKETGAPVPNMPVVFMKPVSAIQHPGASIVIPAACEHGPEVDFEAELAVVIGKQGKDIDPATALDHVLGYTCGNDVSARRWQKHGGGGQWVRGKSFDTFCPLGPVLVTADEIPDPQVLAIRTHLNGDCMQDDNTDDMLFTVAQLIAFLSRDTTLMPGTVILTGTPSGVGFARDPQIFLSPGDVVDISIEGIGVLSNPVTAASGV